jgi:hypothetical protein
LCLATAVLAAGGALSGTITDITDQTAYNVGGEVRIRLQSGSNATASIRYAGENTPAVTDIPISGTDYVPLWKVPWEARTGRYEVDVTPEGGSTVRAATSFAIHR